MDPEQDPPSERSDFGPRGYLPERAARRARKIVLREQMGLSWPLAAVVAALVVLGAGTAFLLTRAGPPGPPFVAVTDITSIDPGGAAVVTQLGEPLLVVRAGGGVRVYLAQEAEIAYCAESGRLEAASGAVYDLDGALVGGRGASLNPLAVQVHHETVYVDPGAPLPAAPKGDGPDAQPVC